MSRSLEPGGGARLGDDRRSGPLLEEDVESGGGRSPEADPGVVAGAAARRRRCLGASFWVKLSLVVVVLVVVSTGVLGLVMWRYTDRELVREIGRRLTTVAILRREQLDFYVSGERERMDLIANRVLILDFLQGQENVTAQAALADLQAAVTSIADVENAAVYNGAGSLAFTTDAMAYPPALSAQELQVVAGGVPQFSLPQRSGGGWIYNISRAMMRGSTVVGTLVSWVNASTLQVLVNDSTGLQKTGELLVGVAHNDTSTRLLLPPKFLPDVSVIKLSPAMNNAFMNQTGFMLQRDYRGVEVVVAYSPMESTGWGVQAKMNYNEAFHPVKNLRSSIFIIVAATVTFGVVCSLLLSRLFISPILELSVIAAALGRGDMSARVKDDRVWFRDEIDELRHTFNSMADQIATYQSTLEQKVAERTRDLARINESLRIQIEERKIIEGELERAKNVAVAADRSKSEFLANMSHEIRTPLNGIINCTELCLDTHTSPEQQEYLDLVRFSAKHLLRIITDILDFSKIEAGKLEMEEIQFSLYDQLEHAVSVLAARAHKKGLELACRVDPKVPDQIIGDPGRLFQVFVNLIGNSIKFTSEGEVVVSASLVTTGGDLVELLFAVRDTGIGIPEQKQSLLFQAFSQVDTSTSRLYGGTGLGLVISSKLAAAMGGRMWVESQGKGTTFYFTSLFHIPPPCDLPSSLRVEGMKGIPALVVDDSDTNRTIVVDMLQSWGMVAVGAGSTEAAKISLQSALAKGQQFKVLLLDMWLQKPGDAVDLIDFLDENPGLLGSRKQVKGYSVGQVDQDTASKASMESDDVDPEIPLCLRQKGIHDLPVRGGVFPRVDGTEAHAVQDSGNSAGSGSGLPPVQDRNISRGNVSEEQRRHEQIRQAQSMEISQTNSGIAKSEQQGAGIRNPGYSSSKKLEELPSLRRPRSASLDGKALSIVMLTSVDHPDAARCRQLGVEVHTSKPIKRLLLLRALHAAMGVWDGQEVTSVDEKGNLKEVKSKGLHILVAEDNAVNQRVAVTLLQKWGHTTVLACNGQEAVEKAAEEEFDLVLMDVQMPVLDGLEATSSIREEEKRRNSRARIPIVAMTAHAMTGDGERCLAAGMDNYVSKPLNAKKLQELLQQVASGLVADSSVH